MATDRYDDPYSDAGMAYRCGALIGAVEMLLETIDEECLVELSVLSRSRVETARKILAEHGARTAVAT